MESISSNQVSTTKNDRVHIISPCDGLCYLETYNQRETVYSHYLLSPGSLTTLPSPPNKWGYADCAQLVFDPSINKHKVVIWYTEDSHGGEHHQHGWELPDDSDYDSDDDSIPDEEYDFHVPGLKTACDFNQCCLVLMLDCCSSWRKLNLPEGCQSNIRSPVVVNKTMYWFCETRDKEILLSMDIATEEIREIKTPDIGKRDYNWQMQVMEVNGEMYFIYCPWKNFHCYTIWVLQDSKNDKWTKVYQKTTKVHRFCNCRNPDYSMVCEEYELDEIEGKAKAVCDIDHCRVSTEDFKSLLCLNNIRSEVKVEVNDLLSDLKAL